jgi:hypothetical protein
LGRFVKFFSGTGARRRRFVNALFFSSSAFLTTPLKDYFKFIETESLHLVAGKQPREGLPSKS